MADSHLLSQFTTTANKRCQDYGQPCAPTQVCVSFFPRAHLITPPGHPQSSSCPGLAHLSHSSSVFYTGATPAAVTSVAPSCGSSAVLPSWGEGIPCFLILVEFVLFRASEAWLHIRNTWYFETSTDGWALSRVMESASLGVGCIDFFFFF